MQRSDRQLRVHLERPRAWPAPATASPTRSVDLRARRTAPAPQRLQHLIRTCQSNKTMESKAFAISSIRYQNPPEQSLLSGTHFTMFSTAPRCIRPGARSAVRGGLFRQLAPKPVLFHTETCLVAPITPKVSDLAVEIERRTMPAPNCLIWVSAPICKEKNGRRSRVGLQRGTVGGENGTRVRPRVERRRGTLSKSILGLDKADIAEGTALALHQQWTQCRCGVHQTALEMRATGNAGSKSFFPGRDRYFWRSGCGSGTCTCW